jgi:hypothetical protein
LPRPKLARPVKDRASPLQKKTGARATASAKHTRKGGESNP